MSSLQLLRSGFPDKRFFGNTFVAMNLARYLEGTQLVSGRHEPQEDVWREIAENQGIALRYANYMNGDQEDMQTLDEVVRKQITGADKPPVTNYHFAVSELQSGAPAMLRERFGRDIRQVMHLHCNADYFLKTPGSKRFEERKALLLGALDDGSIDRFVAVSYGVRDSFASILPEEVIDVVQNGVCESTYAFRDEPDKDAFRNQITLNGQTLVGYSGRLDHVKGARDLARTIRWFNDHPEFDVGFLIATSGGSLASTFEDEVISESPRMFAENRVAVVLDVAKLVGNVKALNTACYDYFEDYVNHHLVPECGLFEGMTPVPAQAMVDVYLQPSKSEGLPLSIIESVFVGTPVVANRVGGVHEIVSDQVGTVIDYHPKETVRVERYAEAILQERERAYGERGEVDTTEFRKEARERLLPRFGASAMASKLSETYEGLQQG